MRRLFLKLVATSYHLFATGVIFRFSAQRGHEATLKFIRLAEQYSLMHHLAGLLHRASFKDNPIHVGGVQLNHPLILAAGFVKGDGFESEAEALDAVKQDKRNVMPGWRIVPTLVGPVEFGSFTRFPRVGNAGTVVWRDVASQSTQNRIGLKNPGAMAAAAFLSDRKHQLPKTFGINIAVSPGVSDIDQQERETLEAVTFFIDAGVIPSWFTLNLSCPNTEDDPLGHQLEAETRQLCIGFINRLQSHGLDVPLWVKISPNLDRSQYQMLIQIFNEVGVKAIIATNTLGQPTPDDPTIQAGVGGGVLFKESLLAVTYLRSEKIQKNYSIDIIGCGGVLDGTTYQDYRTLDVQAVQYWSAMIYRGPLAAAIIESELQNE